MMVSLPIPQSQTAYVYFLGKNCTELPLRYTVVISGNDTVEDVAERIGEIKRVKPGCLKIYGLDNRFQLSYEFKAD